MNTLFKRSVAFLVCVILAVTSAFYTGALTDSEKNKLNNDIAKLQQESKAIQKEINSLKAQKSSQESVLAAIRKKIANTQAQINRCNQEISSINSKIAANKADIDKKNQEIDEDKLTFKKRLRAIYMSNSDSSVKVLLGAESFSQYLQLAQLTASVSSHDKVMIEKIVAAIDELNQKNAENEQLLSQQVAVKNSIAAQQAELKAQENEAAAVYNSIASKQSSQEKDKASIENDIKALQKKLEDSISNRSYSSFINPNTNLQWPVNGFYTVSAGFKSNDSVHKGNHNGIDISGGSIAGQPIRAIANGTVEVAYNGCPHNYKKSGNCCGNGYGNYCVINHGSITIGGKAADYVAYYAHAQRIIVSPGQSVTQGQVIGYVGTTGWSTGYHLHLGILKNKIWANPYPLFF